MKIVNEHLKFPKAPLIEPDGLGYIHLALEVEDSPIPLYFRASKRKREIIARLKKFAADIGRRDDVLNVSVFKAAVKPPLKQPYLNEISDEFHVARYDVVVLIQTTNLKAARTAAKDSVFLDMKKYVEEQEGFSHCVIAENARRIDAVDRSRPGIFLFNYFRGKDMGDTLGIWEYTAGWFTTNTKLDNSTLFKPAADQESQYTVINHCRWDSLIKLMPKLLFMKTLDSYVMENFAVNKVAVMPILYRLA